MDQHSMTKISSATSAKPQLVRHLIPVSLFCVFVERHTTLSHRDTFQRSACMILAVRFMHANGCHLGRVGEGGFCLDVDES